MVRKQPENPNKGQPWPPEVKKQYGEAKYEMKIGKVATDIIVQTRQYKLITPLFGGGVEPGENDPDNLIRATEIRGQLRFWWRAIRGWQFGDDLVAMKNCEDQIWGAASNVKGQNEKEKNPEQNKIKKWEAVVQIIIEGTKEGVSIEPFEVVEKDRRGQKVLDAKPKDLRPEYGAFLSYIAFPLKPSQKDLEEAQRKEDVVLKKLQKDITFTLKISFPKESKEDVEAALWAWETFGGVGARTRRGFGALLLEKINGNDLENEKLPPADPDEAKAWIRAKLPNYSEASRKQLPVNVPRVEAAIKMRVLRSFPRPADAWQQLIDQLRKFRQPRVDSRSGHPSQFGKSLWPEATALRRRLHPRQGLGHTPDKFPRAAFGLPIVFHLAHEKPAKTITLQGLKDEQERWASRLILKPVPCRGKQFLALAILLNGSELPEENLALIDDGKPWKTIPTEQTHIKAGELPGLRDVLGNESDILLAFLNYLKKEN